MQVDTQSIIDIAQIIGIVFSGFAALFAFLSWRWYSVDRALERQQLIQNRLDRAAIVIEYDDDDGMSDIEKRGARALGMNTATIDRYEEMDFSSTFRVKVRKIIVTESNGWRYALKKSVAAEFDGETRIELSFTKTSVSYTTKELPPDIKKVQALNFSELPVRPGCLEINNSDASVILVLECAESDSIERYTANIMEKFQSNLGK